MSEGLVTKGALAPGFFRAASVADVPSGWVLRVAAGGRDLALANREGTFFAVENSCTHAAGPLADGRLRPDCLLECSWHNSLFDARTGEVVRGPARKPVKTYQVQVEEGMVYVKVE
ncbi:MAG: Rieske (2Fe-2S) protein [Actinomycetota bacterium]